MCIILVIGVDPYMSELCNVIKNIYIIFYSDYVSTSMDIPTFIKKCIFNNMHTDQHYTTLRSG